MKLYLISQTTNNGYDTFDAAVVSAPDEETARRINPRNGELIADDKWEDSAHWWCYAPEQVTVEYLGDTTREQGLVLASFNAG